MKPRRFTVSPPILKATLQSVPVHGRARLNGIRRESSNPTTGPRCDTRAKLRRMAADQYKRDRRPWSAAIRIDTATTEATTPRTRRACYLLRIPAFGHDVAEDRSARRHAPTRTAVRTGMRGQRESNSALIAVVGYFIVHCSHGTRTRRPFANTTNAIRLPSQCRQFTHGPLLMRSGPIAGWNASTTAVALLITNS